MEALALYLEEYKGTIGLLAAITTLLQMLSPVTICNDIRKQGHTENTPFAPIIGGLVIIGIMLRYGWILQEPVMIRVTAMGFLLYWLYTACYLYYTKNKGNVVKQLGYGLAILGAVCAYTALENPAYLKDRLGLMVTVLLIVVIASPLFKLKHIIKTKSTEGISFPFVLTGTIASFLWILRAIILRNNFVMIQYALRFVLFAIQLALMAMYPSSTPAKGEKLKKK